MSDSPRVPLNGILLLDKPVGMSSNAALQRVRWLAGGIKAGHGGSLDPLASGMLPICLGDSTRLAGDLLAGRKAYRFGLQLGERSATGDAEGEIVERRAVPELTRERIEATLAHFLGPQQQLPPMYSALKHEGQRLYRLARQGLDVERRARDVTIDTLQLLAEQHDELLELRVLCSKGTYVRVLGEDIARALGTCGRLASLRREYVEPFAAEPMIDLSQLEAVTHTGLPWPLLPPDRAVGHLPALHLSEAAARAISQGRVLRDAAASAAAPGGASAAVADGAAAAFDGALERLWRLYDAQGRFLGVGRTDAEGLLRARRLFPQPVA
jgi:tRNA pseudouridine55 synthase